MPEALCGICQSFAQCELAQARVQQRLERMSQWTAQQFDGLGIDQVAQRSAAAVTPVRVELIEGSGSCLVLANSERSQHFRARRGARFGIGVADCGGLECT
ncbi:Uncharacterised protein [Mycobacteroides abscessus subsp. bolletii]|nr:Uncharacterised protein [Mycobacteroides abscessus subsp. bolletii]SKG55281.1 Uncharacterised protein [Mycobacteroides abscessus subsp. bolletii]SKI54425.1 Uncharacterised protein [Mycobacteroides abscessus subsp. bolletii]SKS39678.1 Uncharacterised protein [Mycobacteroides abscessus subsp. bolletii]SKV44222.1 Uncharacterised protein [Mycobacteroides abscessus subsp. bolletii]